MADRFPTVGRRARTKAAIGLMAVDILDWAIAHREVWDYPKANCEESHPFMRCDGSGTECTLMSLRSWLASQAAEVSGGFFSVEEEL